MGALVLAVVLAQLAYGLCNERVEPDGLTAATCDALGGGESLAVVVVPPFIVLGAALGGRSNRAALIAFTVCAVVIAAIGGLIVAQA